MCIGSACFALVGFDVMWKSMIDFDLTEFAKEFLKFSSS